MMKTLPGLFSREKRKFQGYRVAAWMEVHGEDELGETKDTNRNTRFGLNVRKTFSTTRTIKQRNRLPGEVVPCEPYGMEKISWLICLGTGGWTEPLEVTSGGQNNNNNYSG